MECHQGLITAQMSIATPSWCRRGSHEIAAMKIEGWWWFYTVTRYFNGVNYYGRWTWFLQTFRMVIQNRCLKTQSASQSMLWFSQDRLRLILKLYGFCFTWWCTYIGLVFAWEKEHMWYCLACAASGKSILSKTFHFHPVYSHSLSIVSRCF